MKVCGVQRNCEAKLGNALCRGGSSRPIEGHRVTIEQQSSSAHAHLKWARRRASVLCACVSQHAPPAVNETEGRARVDEMGGGCTTTHAPRRLTERRSRVGQESRISCSSGSRRPSALDGASWDGSHLAGSSGRARRSSRAHSGRGRAGRVREGGRRRRPRGAHGASTGNEKGAMRMRRGTNRAELCCGNQLEVTHHRKTSRQSSQLGKQCQLKSNQ